MISTRQLTKKKASFKKKMEKNHAIDQEKKQVSRKKSKKSQSRPRYQPRKKSKFQE